MIAILLGPSQVPAEQVNTTNAQRPSPWLRLLKQGALSRTCLRFDTL